MTLGRCVVVIPPEGGPYAFGGDRYRGIAESILAPHAEVHHIGWAVGSSAPDRAPWETIMERADALVVAPWLPLIDAPAFEGFWFESHTAPGRRVGHLHRTPEDADGHVVRRLEETDG